VHALLGPYKAQGDRLIIAAPNDVEFVNFTNDIVRFENAN
jgi:hypothetical protein